MQAKLIINGVDFTPWILEEGMEQYELTRQERSVVGLDGIDYRSWVAKRGISVSLTRMKDTTWHSLLDALIWFNIPFTLCKGLLSVAVTFLIYKRISPILKGR